MRLAILGTGYVGLVVGACFAEYGNSVVCIDNNDCKVAQLLNAQISMYEPGLEEIVKDNLASGALEITTDLPVAVNSADLAFIFQRSRVRDMKSQFRG